MEGGKRAAFRSWCSTNWNNAKSINTSQDNDLVPNEHNKIIVTIFMARQLKSVDVGGRSCPYAVVSLKEKDTVLKEYESEYQVKTVSPIWNKCWTFTASPDKIKQGVLTIEVQVYHAQQYYESALGVEKITLGKVSLPLPRVLEAGIKWYKLTEVSPSTGEIQIEVSPSISSLELPHFHFPPDSSSPPSSNKPPNSPVHHRPQNSLPNITWKTKPSEFVVHFDRVGGAVLALKTVIKGKTTIRGSYPVYRISMELVDTIFRDKYQPWNRDYDKAQKIFGDTPGAIAVRQTIAAEHKMLYSTVQRTTGTLYNGEQFLNLINNGIRRGRRRLYTYVLMEQKLYFSETSANFFKDFLSKHSVHSNAKDKVRYAGEFFVLEANSSTNNNVNYSLQNSSVTAGELKYKLIIDNNSGTYSPSSEDLPLLQQVLKNNFPGLIVEALDYKSEKEKEYKKRFKEGLNGTPIIGDEEEEEEVVVLAEDKS